MDALDFIDSISALTHPDEEMLYEFVRGGLTPDRAKSVRDHVSRCPHCRELAELFGWSSVDHQPAEILPLRTAGTKAEARPLFVGNTVPAHPVHHQRSGGPWRRAEAEPLAASVEDTSGGARAADAIDADLVQLVPGATDGDVALGYFCAGGMDIIVIGAGDRPAKVLLNGTEYEVRIGVANEPRVVEGLTRQHVTVWLAEGLGGDFTVVYP